MRFSIPCEALTVMPNCSNCSAPLPADSSRCAYCGTRNNMDFQAINRFAGSKKDSHRQCPDCHVPLQTMHLSIDGDFAIERCDICFGLFFDPGEVQAFLEAAASPTFEFNYRQILNINRERSDKDRKVRYIPCPECGKMMNRVNFGYLSGVVMDQCKAHGVWLDNGELIHLLEWKNSGGQLADKKKKAERQSLRKPAPVVELPPVSPTLSAPEEDPEELAERLVNTAFSLIDRLFR